MATGFAAVGAAAWVGRNQMSISQKQTEILARQVRLQELTLRSDLFEKRYAVYVATREYLSKIMAVDGPPGEEIETRFLLSLDQAKFLFRSEVHDRLDAVRKESLQLFMLKSMMMNSFEQFGHYGVDGEVERHTALLNGTYDRLANLSELFGDELALGN